MYTHNGDDADRNELQEKVEAGLQDWSIKPDILPRMQTTLSHTATDVSIGGKKCKCGSTTNVRVSHKSRPLNKK